MLFSIRCMLISCTDILNKTSPVVECWPSNFYSSNSIGLRHLNGFHKKCSGIRSRLETVVGFQCTNCSQGLVAEKLTQKLCPIKLNGDSLECVDKFFYLGDMIGSGGGAEDAASMRVKCAWGKFRELSPILTARRAWLKLKGKVYRTCVQSVMVYGSETWAMKAEDMQRLEM